MSLSISMCREVLGTWQRLLNVHVLIDYWICWLIGVDETQAPCPGGMGGS